MNSLKYILMSAMVCLSVLLKAQIESMEVTAAGLTCSMCSKAIYKQLVSLPQVEKVATNLKTTSYTISIKRNQTLNPLAVKSKIEDAGFTVAKLVMMANVANTELENNKILELGKQQFIIVETPKKLGNGLVKLQILDKGFVLEKQFKKLIKMADKYPTYNTKDRNKLHVSVI